MAKKMIINLDIDPALNEIERINKSMAFLGHALPEYPHDDGMEEIGTILQCLSRESGTAIKEIQRVAGL